MMAYTSRVDQRLRFGRIICLLAFSTISASLEAAEPNGCGSGWSTYVVPNRIGLLGCELKSSCDEHDSCYSIFDNSLSGQCEYRRCRPDGDLFGKDVCREDVKYVSLLAEAQKRKTNCDAKLGEDVRLKNPNKWGCQALGVVYRYAVKQWGDGAFAGFGTPSQPAAWKQSQDDYNKAITDFLTHASESELKTFVEAADSTAPIVNFCGCLRYTRAEGLVNVAQEDRDACKVLAR